MLELALCVLAFIISTVIFRTLVNVYAEFWYKSRSLKLRLLREQLPLVEFCVEMRRIMEQPEPWFVQLDNYLNSH